MKIEMGFELYKQGERLHFPTSERNKIFSPQQGRSFLIFTYLFIDSFTEDGKQEDSCNWRPKIARN